jgi:hypothetical protein
MPKYLQPYVCPRCNYETPLKKQMNRHFYKTKKLCPNPNNLVLTDEIKKEVLESHVYHIPKKREKAPDTKKSDTHNINNYNLIVNYVNGLGYFEKMNYMLEYEKRSLMCFEEQLEQKFDKRVKRLEENQSTFPYFLDQEGLFRIIDDATKTNPKEIEQFAIYLDKTIHRLKIHLGSEWESYMEEEGIRKLLDLIKSYFLDTYEEYLVKNYYSESSPLKQRYEIKNHLEIYYKFLSIFGLLPIVTGKEDSEIIGHRLKDNGQFLIEEECLKLYKEQKTDVKVSEKNAIKRKILNIVRDNTVQSIQNLNNLILDILKIDSEFKAFLLQKSLLLKQ